MDLLTLEMRLLEVAIFAVFLVKLGAFTVQMTGKEIRYLLLRLRRLFHRDGRPPNSH